jgi:hypothetical protein
MMGQKQHTLAVLPQRWPADRGQDHNIWLLKDPVSQENKQQQQQQQQCKQLECVTSVTMTTAAPTSNLYLGAPPVVWL